MQIELNKEQNLWLLSDEHQYILAQKRANGKFKHIGFYSSLESLLKGCVERCIRLSEATSMQELLLVHHNTISSLNQALHPLDIKIIPLKDIDNLMGDNP